MTSKLTNGLLALIVGLQATSLYQQFDEIEKLKELRMWQSIEYDESAPTQLFYADLLTAIEEDIGSIESDIDHIKDATSVIGLTVRHCRQ